VTAFNRKVLICLCYANLHQPYLLSLGLSKSVLALVWIAGPLSGMLVQPYVGMKSDNCRISWGKRRPFIAGGAVATIVSLMVLAWAKEIVTGTLGLFGLDSESWGVRVTVMVFAVLFVYVLDFAINVSKCLLRRPSYTLRAAYRL
jgi:solute carrier family 45 protein 1/2/4